MIYTVKDGDTLDSIAVSTTGASQYAKFIASENSVPGNEYLYPGLELNIPDGWIANSVPVQVSATGLTPNQYTYTSNAFVGPPVALKKESPPWLLYGGLALVLVAVLASNSNKKPNRRKGRNR